MNILNNDIKYIKGVGPARSKLLNKIGIFTVEDALYYFPKGYDDRSEIRKISEARLGEKNTLKCSIVSAPENFKTRNRLTITKVRVKDETGSAFCIWFNQPYMKTRFKKGDEFFINGKVERRFGQIQINSPIMESTSTGKNLYTSSIIPIYGLTKNLSHNTMIRIMKNVVDTSLDNIGETFSEDILKKYRLVQKKQALHDIHFPANKKAYLLARERLVFEELFMLQLSLFFLKKKNTESKEGIRFLRGKEEIYKFLDTLPYKLTEAQQMVMDDVIKDMEDKFPMNRLIQGDVGSGKTVIAVTAMLKAVVNGYQSAMMVPTEILAEQHYQTVKNMLYPFGINVLLLTSRLTEREKRIHLEQIESGVSDVIIGTHSVIQANIKFNRLGLVITDEQHRFGVTQRAELARKAENPDVLVMSATPIPRTLMHVLYGDLDISIIDQLPAGRKAIKTYHIFPSMRKRLEKFILNEIKKGRQVYMVCSLIEDSDNIDAISAVQLYDYAKKRFNNIKVGLLHGKLKENQKEDIMEKFYQGDIDILVSTTVIEVGVNVPNSTIMVIENAERFGLAQLHQLRGRVGRGNYQAYCILISDLKSKVARERIKVMVNTNDGFEIAEKDLKIRGPGEFFGVKQHGIPELKIADLSKDIRILELAKKAAQEIIDKSDENEEYKKLLYIAVQNFKNKIKQIALN
ncbi:MAG: ATP-dependent DNA helicase RecG [Clostridia bacterium]|nr:ATP-dependent DNA helicase RecG [Clostridia bacterium]